MEVEIVRSDTEKWLEEYLDRINLSVSNDTLTINLDTLRSQNPKCVQAIIQNPTIYHKLVHEWYLARVDAGQKFKNARTKLPHVRVSFEGNLGTNFVTPRGLNSKMGNQLVGIQGIATRVSVSRYQLEKSVHWCEKTTSSIYKQYADEYAPEQSFDMKKTKNIPTTDINGNPLKFEFGKSTFDDIQTGVLQELPEMAPAGLLPRSVNIVLQHDLVDKVKPGDRVQLIGIYRLHPNYQSKENGIIKALFIVTSVLPLASTPSPLTIKLTNNKFPSSAWNEDNILDIISSSIAPSIYGHAQLKKAVLLMLVGGTEKNLENGAHLRGDINLLMIGDPGTAKSQMLRWVLSTVDVGVNTTGSGASGVGLTAAITMDKDTGQRNIEAGAMVLADRGFVCIDQFDKMQIADRVAVHEVMQQQTVTIAKAGIHCSLNARCSVIAAANPIYGEYQKDLPPTRNIGMPDSLLSRFDLIFIIFDQREADHDRRIAERVCKNHRYSTVELLNENNVEDDYIIQPAETVLKNEQMMYEKSALFKGDNRGQILTQAYLRRYVSHCRKNVQPELLNEAIELLSELWTILRSREVDNTKNSGLKVLPITIRSYETLIRLSTAHAKLRLSSEIEIVDCVKAFKLVVFSLYKDQNQLDSELKDAIKKVMGEQFQKKDRTSKKTRVVDEVTTGNKRDQSSSKKRKDQTKQLSNKIKKIKINGEDDEINQVLYGPDERKKITSQVFSTFTKLADRIDKITLDDLLKKLPHHSKNTIVQILEDLDKKGKLFFDKRKNQIITV